MQAAVPFTWEEWPGKPRAAGFLSSSSSRQNLCTLQELFREHSTTSKRKGASASVSLAPPPRLRYNPSDMSTSSGSDLDVGFSCSAATTTDEEEGTVAHSSSSAHGHTSLLDLMRAPEPRAATTSLAELFKSDKKEESNVTTGTQQAKLKNKESGPKSTGKSRMRNSYLPYKQGLISIFCMSPYQGTTTLVSPSLHAGNHHHHHHHHHHRKHR